MWLQSWKGFPKILEICGEQLLEKVSLLKQMPHDWLQHQANVICSPKELPYAGFISSFTTLQNHLIICDMGTILVLIWKKENELCLQLFDYVAFVITISF